MSLLSTITRGRENKPPRLFVYGQEGVGKSLFSASAPNPIFVQTEDGLGEIDTAKFPLAKSLADVTSARTALRDEPHDFQTVVLDSADWLERLIWDRVCHIPVVASLLGPPLCGYQTIRFATLVSAAGRRPFRALFRLLFLGYRNRVRCNLSRVKSAFEK